MLTLNTNFQVILPLENGKMLLASAYKGLLVFDGSKISSFSKEADQYLKEKQLYNGVVLKDGRFAFSTLRGGAIIIDQQGNFLKKIDDFIG